MALAYLGLGSNLGDREANLRAARVMIISAGMGELVRESAVEETEPVDYLDQPRFLNQTVLLMTDRAPIELLDEAKRIEAALGRDYAIRRGPRTIDIDILLYDDRVMDTERLTIPHPEITRRPFVMKQLIEIAPDLVDPRTGKLYREVYAHGGNRDHQRL